MNNTTDTRTELEQALYAIKMTVAYEYEWHNAEVRYEDGKKYLYLPIKNERNLTTTS